MGGINFETCFAGLKLDLSHSTDLTEASALGYNNNYIHVYSNSWGPSDWGFIVSGPGTLVKHALETGVREVRLFNSFLHLVLATYSYAGTQS